MAAAPAAAAPFDVMAAAAPDGSVDGGADDADELDLAAWTALIEDGTPWLHAAAATGQMDALRCLASQSELNATDAGGLTALGWAVRRGQPQCVRLLLERENDMDAGTVASAADAEPDVLGMSNFEAVEECKRLVRRAATAARRREEQKRQGQEAAQAAVRKNQAKREVAAAARQQSMLNQRRAAGRRR